MASSKTKIPVPRTPLELEGAALVEDVKAAKGLAATRETFDYAITRTERIPKRSGERARVRNQPSAAASTKLGMGGVTPAQLRDVEIELMRALRAKLTDFVARAMAEVYAEVVAAEHRSELADRVVRQVWSQIGTLPEGSALESLVESWARASRLVVRTTALAEAS